MVFLRVSGLNIYPCSSEYSLRTTDARKFAQLLSAKDKYNDVHSISSSSSTIFTIERLDQVNLMLWLWSYMQEWVNGGERGQSGV